MIGAAVMLAISAIPGQPFSLVMMWLCFTSLAAYSWSPPFWALPTLTLTTTVAAVSIGLINIFANLAGYFGNHLLGWMKDRGATDRACLFFLAACYLLGGGIVSLVKTKNRPPGSKDQSEL
jgi:ACS family tartrate transporter-like MFS transporter